MPIPRSQERQQGLNKEDTAVLVGITIFGERLNASQGIGMLLVFIAVYLVVVSQNRGK